MKILVENLPADITEDRLKDVFSQIGDVQSVKIKTELLTRKPTGNGVIDMTLDIDAYRAINCLEGAAFHGRNIHVKEAYPLLERAKRLIEHEINQHDIQFRLAKLRKRFDH